MDDTRGLRFACLPECGFCCTATPLVLDHEARALGPLVTRADDGTLRIPVSGVACSSLQADARCGSYEARPSVCKVYPYQAHAGRRIQVVATLACPGVMHGGADGEAMEGGAEETVRMLLGLPGAKETASRAKETFVEFDRRMKEWGFHATSDKLRSAFLPHVETLARPEALPAFFAGIADGELDIAHKPAAAIAALFESEADADLADLFHDASRDAFEENDDALWVEPAFGWSVPSWRDGRVTFARHRPGRIAGQVELDVAKATREWSLEGSRVLAAYLARLTHRDHTEGAAAWLVDQSGYQATHAAAYARVLGEASLQVALRAGLLAAEAGVDEIDAAWAARGISAYETSYHSLPTIGAIL